jgi:ubiquinone/menaquinone biosynthesis C-methylase UbiE
MSGKTTQQLAQDEKDKLLFDRIARKYAKKDVTVSTSIPRKYQIQYAVSKVTHETGRAITIADIGCGVGASAQYLADYCSHYVGIDHSAEMIEIAKEMDWGRTQTEFIAADIKSPELHELSSDMVLAIGALHHMTELDEVMDAVKRMSKQGGWFVAIEPQRGNPVISLARWIRKRIDRTYSEDQHFFSASELRELCERNGFVNIELEYQGFFSKPFGQVILPFEPLARIISTVSVAVDRVLDRHLPGPFRRFSWDVIVRAQIPGDQSNGN